MLKILHITNEITKKNFSISSLINFILKKGEEKNFFSSKVLCSNTDYPKKNNNLIIKGIKWRNFFYLRKIFLNQVIRYDVIHIHGMWAPIQLYSIILCLIYSKKTIIHPHGMLLEPAINENGIIKKFNKRIFLYFLKFLFYKQKNITFVAITKDEYKQIRKLFSKLKVELIQNNIPFESFKFKQSSDIKKKFVFFGRIHPHKNIIEMINYFIQSELIKEGWKLEIYGIPDDKNYLSRINKLIINYPSIKILKPVFGLNKSKIINNSWANILISKSEVLSFSVLESGTYGLPSIITENIETLENDKFSQKVKNNTRSIINKFKEISNWSQKKRIEFGINTSFFFKKYKKKSDEIIIENLQDSYQKLYNEKIFVKGRSSENFYIASFAHSLNVFMPNIILLLSFLIFKSEMAAEIGLTNIIFITLTQMLSGNTRLIAIKKKDVDFLQNSLFFRLFLGAIFIILFLFISYYFSIFDDFYTNLIISCFIVLLWCSELVISVYEIRRNIGKLLIILVILVFFFLLNFLSFLSQDLNFVQLTLSLSCCILLFLCIRTLIFLNIKKLNLIRLKSFFKDTLKYFSSLSLTLSSLCWRFYLYFTYPKEISGIIFIAFAICSFPGTFFNNVLGPNYFYNKIKINPKIKYFFLGLFIFLIGYNIIDFNIYDQNQINNNNLFFHLIKISAVGSFIMFFAMYTRQELVFSKKITLTSLFYKDITYGLILILILPLLDIFGGLKLMSYSYLAGSLFALIIFKSGNLINENYYKNNLRKI